MKRIFVIPGFRQKATDKCFEWLTDFLVSKDFEVIGVPITWNRHTMADYALQFENFYNKNKSNENYVLGFSYGAVIAFITASRLKPKKIFLCSLSPDFKEDLPHTKQWVLDYIGKKRVDETRTRSGKKIAKELSVPAVVFYGEVEGSQYPQLKKRCEETVMLANDARLVFVKSAHHDISHPEYIAAIKKQF